MYGIGVALAVIACILVYLHLRYRRGNWKKLSIADLLAMTFVLAAPFAYWKHLQSTSQVERQLWNDVAAAGGGLTSSAWVPGVLASRLPNSILDLLRRTREVRVEHPTEAMVQRLVEQPEVKLLRLGGGDFDLRLLDRLATNPHLVDLRIAGKELDSRTMQVIGACKRVRRLNLMRTNVSIESLSALNELSDLESLNLIHCDVDLSKLGDAPWTRSIRYLWLPHPQPGDPASVRIVGWPNLEGLLISEYESQANATPMSVHLEDLPKLEIVYLDVFQKFDLKFRNLPVLAEITPAEYEWQARIPRGGMVPAQPWCGVFDFAGVPALKKLHLFVPGLNSFQIRDAPNFEYLGAGAYYRTLSNSVYESKLKPEVVAAILEGIGGMDGPIEVDLDAVPLTGGNFAPLAQNDRIETLKLSYSGTKLSQWKALSPMKGLKRLDLHGCEIDDAGIRWALETFPEMEHLAIFPRLEIAPSADNFYFPETETLEIIDRPNLKTIEFGDYSASHFLAVRVVDSPNLSIPLELGYLRNLELENAKSIKGISVSGPFPNDAKLSGLDKLGFFAAGGPGVTDDVIDSITDCKVLLKLTLAYPADLSTPVAIGIKLLPQWFGEPGDAISFCLSASKTVESPSGDLMFASLVGRVGKYLSFNAVHWTSYDRARINRGIEELVRRGDDIALKDWNLWALLMTRTHDLPAADPLLVYFLEHLAAPPYAFTHGEHGSIGSAIHENAERIRGR